MLRLLGLIIVLFGVILIYDARTIAKDKFSFGDLNEATSGLKIIGSICSIIGSLIVYVSM